MSEQSEIAASRRDRAGKGAARAVRREGLVPAVVYGENKEPSMISLDPRVVMKGLVQGHFYNTVYSIKIEGGDTERALARDVQFHPVTDDPLHVDFLRVGARTRISVAVPIVFLNDEAAPGIKEGGNLSVVRHDVEVTCRADIIPEEIEVDLTGLEIGDTVRISDVKLPEGVEPTVTDRDFMIASIVGLSAMETEEELEDDEAEGEEGEGEEDEEEGDGEEQDGDAED